MLQEAYPHHVWDLTKFGNKHQGSMKSSQRFVFKTVQEIFPDLGIASFLTLIIFLEVLENFLGKRFTWDESGRFIELDVYVPEIKLAFERMVIMEYFIFNLRGG